MKQNFEIWCNRAFDYEGRVYENVPGDRGGPTKWGITIGRVATRKGVKLPREGTSAYSSLVAELKALTPDDIKSIYKLDYWDAVRGDELPRGLDFSVADMSLNSGPSRAANYLCRLAGVKQSGKVTDEALAKLRTREVDDLVNAYCDARASFLETISRNPGQMKFRKGWLSRVRDVRAKSLSLVTMQPMTEPDPLAPDIAMPKADPPKTTTKDLVKVSRKAAWLVWIERAFHTVWGLFALDKLLSGLDVAQDVTAKVKAFVTEEAQVLAIVGAILGALAIKYVISLMREDVDEGRAIPSGIETA
jgi:lysozyme family protein